MSDPGMKLLVPPETETWELISQGPTTFTQRFPVPGGWLYRTSFHNGYGTAIACCFVPDGSAPGPFPAQPPAREGFP